MLWSPLTSVKVKTVNKPILLFSMFSEQLSWDVRPWETQFLGLLPTGASEVLWLSTSRCENFLGEEKGGWVGGPQSQEIWVQMSHTADRPMTPEVCWGFKSPAVLVVLPYDATYLTYGVIYDLVNALLAYCFYFMKSSFFFL